MDHCSFVPQSHNTGEVDMDKNSRSVSVTITTLVLEAKGRPTWQPLCLVSLRNGKVRVFKTIRYNVYVQISRTVHITRRYFDANFGLYKELFALRLPIAS